jgi:hypothetical protein
MSLEPFAVVNAALLFGNMKTGRTARYSGRDGDEAFLIRVEV